MFRSVKPRPFWPEEGLWRHPDFLKLWAGQTISEFGTQFSLIALPGGPGVAGPLVRLVSAPYAILVDVASFVASSVFVVSIRRPEAALSRDAAERRGMKRELMEGLRYVLRHPHLRAIATCTANS